MLLKHRGIIQHRNQVQNTGPFRSVKSDHRVVQLKGEGLDENPVSIAVPNREQEPLIQHVLKEIIKDL